MFIGAGGWCVATLRRSDMFLCLPNVCVPGLHHAVQHLTPPE